MELELPWPTGRQLTNFLRKVERKEGCLVWTGALTSSNYGAVRIAYTTYQAHRLSYRWFKGTLKAQDHVHHICGNRKCVKPSHLEAMHQLHHIQLERVNGVYRGKYSDVTHCKHGHPFSDENTYHYKSGRYCRTCRSRRFAEFIQRRKGGG